jgi:hypothetical protein
MEPATRLLVRTRAGNRCEYCLLPQDGCSLTHHIEHIIPRQHEGRDDHDNLALACHRCNLLKGPNLTGIDPITGEIGRTTVKLLAMNNTRRIERRELSEPRPREGHRS